MILPSKNRKVASVAVILKRMRGSDHDQMKEQNSEYMTSTPEMMGEEGMQETMNEQDLQSLKGPANKVMMALKQNDLDSFTHYMLELIKHVK